MRDEIAQLAKALEPSFAAPEDAELAATMMVMALRYELGQPATEADQLRYRAALERLPKGSTAIPRVVFVSPYDQKTDPHWRVTFTVGPSRYESPRRFGSVVDAETFVSDVAIFASISSARIAFRAWRVPLSSAPISP